MIFTIEQLINFFDQGVADGATYMIVVTRQARAFRTPGVRRA